MPEMLQRFSEGKRRKTLTKLAVETVRGAKGAPWKALEDDRKRSIVRGMWEHFSCERSKAKKFRQLADEEKQAGIQGQWQLESPAREYLEQVKCCHDTDCTERMMKKCFTALKGGSPW